MLSAGWRLAQRKAKIEPVCGGTMARFRMPTLISPSRGGSVHGCLLTCTPYFLLQFTGETPSMPSEHPISRRCTMRITRTHIDSAILLLADKCQQKATIAAEFFLRGVSSCLLQRHLEETK